MKKIITALVVLALVAPAWAAVTITATDEGGGVVRIDYSGPSVVRAFGLDITVDAGAITAVTSLDPNYWVYPGSIDINTTTGEVNDFGSLIGDPCVYPGVTLGGLGTNGATIEMAALYWPPGAGSPNAPGLSGAFLSVVVSQSCTLTVAANTARGGVVLGVGGAPSTNLPTQIAVGICTVPNVLDMNETDANMAITGAGFTTNVTSYAWDDGEAAGEVLTQNPAGGATPVCGTPVDLTVSLGPCVVPNVVADFNDAAQTAITNAGFTVGTITYDCNDSIADGNVLSTNPAGGATPGCGTAVDIVVSVGTYTGSDIALWRELGMPSCWCASINPRQCHGDADGLIETKKYWVLTNDLSVFLAGWFSEWDPKTAVDSATGVKLICADFGHDIETKKYRVLTSDLTIFLANWFKVGLPDPNCP